MSENVINSANIFINYAFYCSFIQQFATVGPSFGFLSLKSSLFALWKQILYLYFSVYETEYHCPLWKCMVSVISKTSLSIIYCKCFMGFWKYNYFSFWGTLFLSHILYWYIFFVEVPYLLFLHVYRSFLFIHFHFWMVLKIDYT